MNPSPGTIPALSVRQPWAELILSGRKTVENRFWKTAYRGPIYLHTGKNLAQGFEEEPAALDLFRGGYVGMVTIQAVVEYTAERWQEWHPQHLDQAPYRSGAFAWILKDPRRLPVPIAAPGGQKFFTPEVPDQLKLGQALGR